MKPKVGFNSPIWLRCEEARARRPQRDSKARVSSSSHAHTLCTSRSRILKHTHKHKHTKCYVKVFFILKQLLPQTDRNEKNNKKSS